MKHALSLLALCLGAIATPGLAAGPESAIVMTFRLPDGTTKEALYTAPDGLSLRECNEQIRDVLPIAQEQMTNAEAFPEFAGGQLVRARCERYTEDLVQQLN